MIGARSSRISAGGFTLVELVVAIVLTAVITGFAAMFMTTPVDAYFAQTRRSELAESSEAMTRQLSEDLRHAVPFSVRIRTVGSRSIVEMLIADDVVFYRTVGAQDEVLAINDATERKFATVGKFQVPVNGRRLVVGNTGVAPNNVYVNANLITPKATAITSIPGVEGEDIVSLSAPFNFKSQSHTNRVFLVQTPVTYICNSAAKTLRRYSNYTFGGANAPASEADARLNAGGVVNSVISRDVTACRLTCSTAQVPCQGVLIADLAVSRANATGNDMMRVFLEERMEDRQ